ncbi:MAG TPA: type II toxin-antitoxin system death-on-curing family toxin [Ensifer sp.]|nr:type II toxin-antitoxin system death-on-curing family toxin [Ensifer sp.]
MNKFKWLTRDAIEIMHQEQLLAHGGLPTIRNLSALESALARPQNKTAYGVESAFPLAAAYICDLTQSQPFSDGNKATSLLAALTFLWINGFILEAEQSVVIAFVLSVAAGEIDEEGATRFFRDFCVPLK